MRNYFVSFVKNRFLLADLAFEMLDRGWVQTASEIKVRSIASTLLSQADDGSYAGVDSVDEFLQRACATEFLSIEDHTAQWRSVQAQSHLATPALYARYGQQNSDDEQKAAAWLQEKAALPQWREPIAMLIWYSKRENQARQIAQALTATAPALATGYHERLQRGFFDQPWFERRFLAEIAWPLGDVAFWEKSLEDQDPDTRRQAALVLGTARVARAQQALLVSLNDTDDRVRAWAVWAWGRLAAADASAHLLPLAKDPGWRVRFQTRQALALLQGAETEFSARPVVERADRAGKKILISDDHSQWLDFCQLILEKKGYQLLYAPGGAQTLDLARREHPALIVSDIMNVHQMGTDLVFDLKSEPATREIPLLLASAQPILWFSGPLPWLGLFWGADAYIQRPFGPEEFLRLIDAMLTA